MTSEQLFQTIEQIVPDYETADTATIVAALNSHEDVTERHEPISSAELMDVLGLEDANTVFAKLDELASSSHPLAAVISAAYSRLNAAGLDFANPQMQAMIPALGFDDELSDKLLSLGVKREPKFADPITSNAVLAAMKWRTLTKRVTGNYNAAIELVNSGADWAAVEAALVR